MKRKFATRIKDPELGFWEPLDVVAVVWNVVCKMIGMALMVTKRQI